MKFNAILVRTWLASFFFVFLSFFLFCLSFFRLPFVRSHVVCIFVCFRPSVRIILALLIFSIEVDDFLVFFSFD